MGNCGNFNSIQSLEILYFSHVRTKLEYASTVWNPIYECYNMKMRNVRRKFLNFLVYKSGGKYPETGVSVNIYTV